MYVRYSISGQSLASLLKSEHAKLLSEKKVPIETSNPIQHILDDILSGTLAMSTISKMDLENTIAKLETFHSIVVIVPGVPSQRAENQSWISLDANAKDMDSFKTLQPMFEAIGSLVEKASGQSLHPVTISINSEIFEKSPETVLIFDISSGKLIINSKNLGNASNKSLKNIMIIYKALVVKLENLVTYGSISEPKELISLMVEVVKDLPQLLKESIWWCITCTVILSISLPFILNYGFVELAQLICQWQNLAPSDCLSLQWDALGLALILLPLLVYPVIEICGLMQCQQ